ncbi:hypothetical protein DW734_14250 [Klebsiella pneumoniae]|nr:hypothetical protein DW734_14250 [Klebsiella pneumoniae]
MAEQESRLAIRLDSSGAEKQADSLTVALDKMTLIKIYILKFTSYTHFFNSGCDQPHSGISFA